MPDTPTVERLPAQTAFDLADMEARARAGYGSAWRQKGYGSRSHVAGGHTVYERDVLDSQRPWFREHASHEQIATYDYVREKRRWRNVLVMKEGAQRVQLGGYGNLYAASVAAVKRGDWALCDVCHMPYRPSAGEFYIDRDRQRLLCWPCLNEENASEEAGDAQQAA